MRQGRFPIDTTTRGCGVSFLCFFLSSFLCAPSVRSSILQLHKGFPCIRNSGPVHEFWPYCEPGRHPFDQGKIDDTCAKKYLKQRLLKLMTKAVMKGHLRRSKLMLLLDVCRKRNQNFPFKMFTLNPLGPLSEFSPSFTCFRCCLWNLYHFRSRTDHAIDCPFVSGSNPNLFARHSSAIFENLHGEHEKTS